MKKKDTLTRWSRMRKNQNPLPNMTPIPYKSKGSKYGTAGIRIDGPPEFIDAVLSNLKDLLAGENHITRLELSRSKVDKGFKALPNAGDGAECCYIRLHQRGGQGVMASTLFDRTLDANTKAFEAGR